MRTDDVRWTDRLALGTAQFGLPYGISNVHGKVAPTEVGRILDVAHAAGVMTLDTAAAYGDAETVLGAELRSRPAFEIVSKCPPGIQADRFIEALEGTLGRLRRPQIKACLAHRFDDFRDPSLRSCMVEARERCLIRQFGASLYHPEEAQWILDEDIAVDLVIEHHRLAFQASLKGMKLVAYMSRTFKFLGCCRLIH